MTRDGAWVQPVPDVVRELQARWSLSLSTPLDSAEASCSWVAFAERRDGTRAVLKLGMPHMEAAHEIQGLRFWDGDGIVRLFEADEDLNAMLLERCEPGTPLRALPETEQDVVIARLLHRVRKIAGAQVSDCDTARKDDVNDRNPISCPAMRTATRLRRDEATARRNELGSAWRAGRTLRQARALRRVRLPSVWPGRVLRGRNWRGIPAAIGIAVLAGTLDRQCPCAAPEHDA